MKITEQDLSLEFPKPAVPLIEDPGPPVPWEEFMDRIAAQTRRYLREYGSDTVPPEELPEEPFTLD